MNDYYDEPTDLPSLKDWLIAAIITLGALIVAAVLSEVFK